MAPPGKCSVGVADSGYGLALNHLLADTKVAEFMPLLSNDLCFKTLNDDIHADNNELATQENVNKLLSFIDLAAGASVDTNNVFHISDKLRDSTQMGKCLALMKEDPATSAMLAERDMGPDFDLEELSKMPENSFGWTYAKVMKRTELNIEPVTTDKFSWYSNPKIREAIGLKSSAAV